MERDGMSAEDALDLINEFKSELEEYLDESASLDEIEQLFEDYFGLEPDYLMEFLPL